MTTGRPLGVRPLPCADGALGMPPPARLDSANSIGYNQYLMTFKAVGFDIDGTLYPSFRLYLPLAGFAVRNYRSLKAFNTVRHELRDPAALKGLSGFPPSDIVEFRRLQTNLMARRLGTDEATAEKIVKSLFYREVPETFARVRPFKDVRAALTRLREGGFLLGALSDFPGDRKLELMGLRDLFHVSMTSEETGVLKPDPRPIRLLAERLGVSPGELLYVGNSVACDVAGAKAAGAGAALIRCWGRGESYGADFVFRRYGKLVDWVLE